MKMHPRVLPYANCEAIAFDTETTGLDWWDRRFRMGGYVLYHPYVGGDYIPVGHETLFDAQENEDPRWVADSIRELARNKSTTWIMHNRGYDENVVGRDNISFAGTIVDTIGLWWTINPHPDPNFSLKGLGDRWVEKGAAQEQRKLEQFIKKNKLKRYTQVPVDVMAPYAIQDGKLTWDLWQKGLERLPSDQEDVHDTEQRWIGLLSRMAARGVPVDTELSQSIIDSHLAEAHRIQIAIAKATGIAGFNPGSPAQVAAAATKLGESLPDTTARSIQQSNLPEFFRIGVVKYRQLIHTVGSYLEPMIKISQNSIDGRVHTSFRTTTKTGRLASSDPINMQGLPKQRGGLDESVHRVREVIRPESSDKSLIFNDFAQIDVRVGAHYAKDQALMEILKDPEGDVHALVQSEIREMGIDLDRRTTKELVFGSQYGIGSKSFAAKVSGLNEDGEWVEISENDARTYLMAHRSRFRAIPHILQQAETIMKSRGYITLWDGRKIGCPEDEDPHKAFAWLIQGGGAQIIKRAMIGMEDYFEENKLDAAPVLQVHDEVVAECDTEQETIVANVVAWYMASVWKGCRVPLYVRPAIADPSWATVTELGHPIPSGREEWEAWARGGELPLPI